MSFLLVWDMAKYYRILLIGLKLALNLDIKN